MAEQYFNRYGIFTIDGYVKTVPFIKLEEKATDIKVTTKENTRFDVLSQKYYGNGKHGFLILQANPQFGGLEFDIPRGTTITIPFPFLKTLQEYQEKIKTHIQLYGL
jgi:phage tail protein X